MLIIPETSRVPRTEDNYIHTASGRKFWPLDPRADEIFIEDIAHHLANECRFGGATCFHYSVAQHSLHVSYLAENLMADAWRNLKLTPINRVIYTRAVALWGLLHDAPEAYLKDIPRPIKHAPGFGELYLRAERTLMAEVITRFDLLSTEPHAVKVADVILCNTEQRDLLSASIAHRVAETLPEMIRPMEPAAAEKLFLHRFHALTKAREAEHLATVAQDRAWLHF